MRNELASRQRIPVTVHGEIRHGRVDGGGEVIAATASFARAHVHRHLHRTAISAHHARVDLDEITNVNWLVEANAAGINSNCLLTSPLHGAPCGGLMDPVQSGATVNIAAPVNIRGLGQETVDHTWGI